MGILLAAAAKQTLVMHKLKEDDILNEAPGVNKIFEFDTAEKDVFVADLKKREDQLEGMLLWCSIIILVSYLAVMITVIKYFMSLEGGNPVYLGGIVLFAMLLFGAFIWLQYRLNAYQPTGSNVILKELLMFKTHMAHRQMGLLKIYIIAYSAMVCGLYVLCGYYAGNAQQILQATVPLSIMIYGTGLFLLINLAYKRKKYLNYIKTIDDGLLKEFGKQ